MKSQKTRKGSNRLQDNKAEEAQYIADAAGLDFTPEEAHAREVSPISNGGDDPALRPPGLDDFTGQQHIRDILKVSISGARGRGEVIEHILLYGPPGLGKTTLAQIIHTEMQQGGSFRPLSAPTLQKPYDLASILVTIAKGDVLFLDEIHRLHPSMAELLYGAMEDFRIDIPVGEGGRARDVSITLPKFTLIGATTRSGVLPRPFRDRFGLDLRLEPYSNEELASIALRSARLLGLEMEAGVEMDLARRSRGTPRIINRLVRRLRDGVAHHGTQVATHEIAQQTFARLRIDDQGLDEADRLYLECLTNRFRGGPAGIEALAAALGEEVRTLEDEIEPWLLRCGLIERTRMGRILSSKRGTQDSLL